MACRANRHDASDFFRHIFGVYNHAVDEIVRIERRPIIRSRETKLVSMGSCFASNVPSRMRSMGFTNAYFDIVTCRHFSCETLATVLKLLAASGRNDIPQEDILLYEHADAIGGVSPYQFVLFRSFLEHDVIIRSVRERCRELKDRLKECEHVIITLGTNIVCRMNDGAHSVTETAGMGKGDFHQHFCDAVEVADQLDSITESLSVLCRKKPQIVYTISPQRYSFVTGGDDAEFYGLTSKSHFVTNSLSKAVLRVALDMHLKRRGADRLHYFPSYEIVLDELRQHEVFSDGLHVSVPSVSHVVARFMNTFFSEKLQQDIAEQASACVVEARTLGRLARGHESLKGAAMVRFFRHLLWRDASKPDVAATIAHCLTSRFAAPAPDEESITALTELLFERFDRLVFWGASGRFASLFLEAVARFGTVCGKQATLVDSMKSGEELGGLRIEDPESLRGESLDCLIITTTFRQSVFQQLRQLSITVKVVA